MVKLLSTHGMQKGGRNYSGDSTIHLLSSCVGYQVCGASAWTGGSATLGRLQAT